MQKKAVFAILFALVFMIQIFAWMTYEPKVAPEKGNIYIPVVNNH